MTDEDKALVERVAMLPDGNAWPSTVELLCDLRDRIEAQAAEIERLRKVIKVQASAVRTLQANEETEINILRQQTREWHQAVSSLDSEREANAILTAEIEKLRDLLREVTPPPHFGESEQSKANHGGSRPAQHWRPAMTDEQEAMREEIARIAAPMMEGGREFDQCPPDRIALRKWNREGMCSINDATQDDALTLADALLPIITRERERAARAALDAAGDVCGHWRERYAAASDEAKTAKKRVETRDFESMGMACLFRESDIRAISPADIVKGMK